MTPPRPMTCIAPTIAEALGIRAPSAAAGAAISEITEDLTNAQRIAVLAPDALDEAQLLRFSHAMPFLRALWQQRQVTLRAERPSITPVNLATMITGCGRPG